MATRLETHFQSVLNLVCEGYSINQALAVIGAHYDELTVDQKKDLYRAKYIGFYQMRLFDMEEVIPDLWNDDVRKY